MVRRLNRWKQTRSWEQACLKSRRNLNSRKRRLLLFKIKKTDKGLDLGCGDGLNLKLLKEMGIKDLTGVDISEDLIEKAKKMNPEVKFYLASAEKLPFKSNSFNIVLVDSVFHHFLRYDKALSEIKEF